MKGRLADFEYQFPLYKLIQDKVAAFGTKINQGIIQKKCIEYEIMIVYHDDV